MIHAYAYVCSVRVCVCFIYYVVTEMRPAISFENMFLIPNECPVGRQALSLGSDVHKIYCENAV